MDLLLRLLGLVVVVVAAVQADAIDATRTPNAFGSDVVNAVVDSLRSRCIFSEDRMFLRRLAYVETKDGTDTNTYRPGYDGGIWQVDQSAFSVTVNCSLYIQSTCSTIKQEFGIDWPSVAWSDLRKPLYSGIAATLFILLELRGNASRMPADLAGQETFWIHNYHQGQAQQKSFSQLAAEATTFVCKNPMDIVFIVDSSGSITSTDFALGLNFVALVVDALNVPQDRVAVLTFESLPHVQFRFDTYNTKNQLAAAIRSIVKISGGTATNLALDTARTVLFPQARPNVNHVAVLITDGQSASIVATIAAANLLKKSGVTVFAIGIGGYYLPELKGVASDPNCSYVYTLDSFSEMDSILHEIQKRTCEASVTLTTGTDSYLGTGSNDGDGSTFVVPPLNHTGLVVNVTCGILDVYISYTNPNPNPALYAEKLTATEGHPVYLQFESSHDGRPAYITVVGTKLPSSSLGLGDCIDFSYSVTVVENLVVVRCCDGLECRECSATDIRQEPQLRKILCGNENVVNPNPCTQLALNSGKFIHPYPYDPAKFIRCDYMGRTYVTLCPNRQTFNPTTLACGYHTPGSSYSTLLPSGYPNPCTPYQIQSHHFFFQYTPDHKQFIHCDLWGNAWLQSCPSLEVWDQNLLTCVLERPIVVVTTKGPVTIVNPCTPYNMAHGLLFHPYPCDHTRFIHCDVTGNYYVQSCPSGLFYNPDAFVCVPGDPQSSGGCEQ